MRPGRRTAAVVGCVLGAVAAGCGAIVGFQDSYVDSGDASVATQTTRRDDSSSGNSGSMGSGDAMIADVAAPVQLQSDGGCDPAFKKCSEQCAAQNDPNFGCVTDTCSACAVRTNATLYCNGGTCAFECLALGDGGAHFQDCDHSDSNGCEVDVTNDPMNCGACGNRVRRAGPVLRSTARAGANAPPTAAPSKCTSKQTDPANCGACNNACPTPPNSQRRCATPARAIFRAAPASTSAATRGACRSEQQCDVATAATTAAAPARRASSRRSARRSSCYCPAELTPTIFATNGASPTATAPATATTATAGECDVTNSVHQYVVNRACVTCTASISRRS